MTKDCKENEQARKMSILILEYLAYPLFKLLLVIWYLPMVLIGLCRKKRTCVPAKDPPDFMLIPARELARRIASKEVSCRLVIESYKARIKEANVIINAVVEDCFGAALQEAEKVDEKLRASHRSVEQLLEECPLLGVPLTVKESIGVKGMSNAAGYFLADGRKAKDDADIIRLCRKAGAIIIAVSNTPELCLNWESYNNLTGLTKNPYDSRRTAGGSSGGEAALLGSGASVIGLGSDIAGSLRLPAHYCGIFSHKPTPHVVSTEGHYPTSEFKKKWNSHFVLGPMTRYASDLLPMMRVITKEEYKTSLDLTKEVNISKVKIYFLKEYGSVLCSNLDSEISTAFDFLLDHFKIKYNLDVQPLKKTFLKKSLFPVLTTLIQIKGVEYEHPKNTFFGLLKVLFHCSDISLNTYMFNLMEWYGKIVSESSYKNCNDFMDHLRSELEALLGDDGVLIMPTFHRTADFHYTTTPRLFDTMNAMIFNALGMPVSSCPIGWSASGLPFGVQVVSKRYNDRLSMAVAEEIENICGGWRMPQSK